MSNIYKIKTSEINDFVSYHNTNKIILFYKQDCLACKLQIEEINKLSQIYKDNTEYAICDIVGKSKFCISNDIIHVPTLHIYKNDELYKKFDTRQAYEDLQKEIESLCIK